MNISIEEYSREVRAKYGDRRRAEFKAEYPAVQRYYQTVLERIKETYTIEKVLAIGGTGIVHVGHHNRFPQQVVLKFNRPIAGGSMVEHEADVLPTLNHPNIIRMLDRGDLESEDPKLTYVVEPFIAGSKPLFAFAPVGDEEGERRVKDTWLYIRLDKLRATLPDALQQFGSEHIDHTISLACALLGDLAALFSQWVSLLNHLHSSRNNAEHGYVYLDVKPENVLVDQHSHLTSIDYGSVEHLDPDDHSPIDVFFTDRYAHPELLKRKLDKPSANRVHGGLKRSELTPAFDYFSLGASMLQILNAVALTRPHVIPQIPLYRSLHFLGTRLLDGQNSSRKAEDHYPYASQVFPSLTYSDYSQLGYTNLEDAQRDLEKERGRWNLENEVPELASYSKDIVRMVPGFNTVLTTRLRRVIGHPLVARLKCVTQLGLVSLLYPTADHSRYDHSLGSYTYTTYYVKSLFNDLGNPIFRNLVGAEDLNALLLATLLHDLGQYPLAHDLEEVHAGIFKHGRITELLLEDVTTDDQGRTLLQIIEDPQNGWGVRGDDLRRILKAHSKNLVSPQDQAPDKKQPKKEISFKTEVLASIVDGPVDADKADYIIRDSARCELPYGRQLDVERLLRVLTLAILTDEASPGRRVTLGVYDKGLASAHAFGQARYLLFSTVYWHHTSRITKAMLQYATVMGLPRKVFGPSTSTSESAEVVAIRERLLHFIKSLVPPFEFEMTSVAPSHREAALDMAAAPPSDVFAGMLAESAEVEDTDSEPASGCWYPGVSWTDWLMLKWIAELPTASTRSRKLVHGLQIRKLYKRVAAFARGGPHRILIEALDGLNWAERMEVCERLHDRVHKKLSNDWAYVNTHCALDKSGFEELCHDNLLVLIDIPNPTKKVGYDRPLGIVPELKEKSYYQHTRQATEDEAWRNIMTGSMAGIGPIRVLCHPEIRTVLGSVFAPIEGEPLSEGHRGVEVELAGILMEIVGMYVR